MTKRPGLNFLPLLWNNKYILCFPVKTLLVPNTCRLIVLIQCDQGEMAGYLALFWSLAYETPSLCLKEKSLRNRNHSDTQIRKGLNCPETFYLLHRCCLWILSWLNNTAASYFVLNNRCPSVGGKEQVCSLDWLVGANRNGDCWRLADMETHLVSVSCSQNS